MDILDKIFTWPKKKRAVITDDSAEAIYPKFNTLKSARLFAESLDQELLLIEKINELLNAPLIEFNINKHLKMTLPPKRWLNDGKPLAILFLLETSEPICAYFLSGED